jgi:hypothetical protein
VPLVILALALSSCAEWLTRIASQQGVDCPGKRPRVKVCEVVPDGGRDEVSSALGCDDGLPGVFLPFDKASSVEAGFGKHEAHIQASAA